jgi:hypothetical protein
MTRRFFSYFLTFLFLLWSPVLGNVDSQKILSKIEETLSLDLDATAKIHLVEQSNSLGTRELEFVYYRQDKNDKFLLVFISPEYEKGNGYLKSGENFWLYRSNTRLFQHISRVDSIGGTDAEIKDFEKQKLTELYVVEKDKNNKPDISTEKIGKNRVYKIVLKAKDTRAPYPKRIYWVKMNDFLPLKEQSYSLSGTLIETNYFLKYAKIGSRFIPVKALFVDEFEKGNKTLLDVVDISLQPIPDHYFTKAYLESLSK